MQTLLSEVKVKKRSDPDWLNPNPTQSLSGQEASSNFAVVLCIFIQHHIVDIFINKIACVYICIKINVDVELQKKRLCFKMVMKINSLSPNEKQQDIRDTSSTLTYE